MTTNPSIPIPEAAIDAGAFALLECMPTDTPSAYFRFTNEGRVAAEAALRAAAPHLVGELVDILRYFDKLFPGSLNCDNPILTGHGEEQCGSCWECSLGYTLQRARKALRALEAPSE